jgi:lysophospholipase L1-like esterase
MARYKAIKHLRKPVFILVLILTAGCGHSTGQHTGEDAETPPDTTVSEAAGTLIIMPLGDSFTNDSRPRVKLWNLLTKDGYEPVYVGDQRQTSSIPDPDHEGVGGITIGGIKEKTAHLMETHRPAFVLLMVGTNDIAWYFDETGREIAARWNDLIREIFRYLDDQACIVAATIPPVSQKIVGKQSMADRDRAVVVRAFNEALRNHVSERKNNGEKIILADVEARLDATRHLSSDGVHLNDEGYAIMGRVYYESLTDLLHP